jgi:hypothetical protein
MLGVRHLIAEENSNMTPSQSIIIGVVSGLITGSLVFLLSQIIRKIIIPWYQEFIYSGIIVSGTWEVNTLEQKHHRKIIIELKQQAHKLTGISTHIAQDEAVPGDQIRTYILQGKIHNRFVSLTGESVDSKRLGAVSFLLEIVGDGQVMEGHGSAYSTVTSQITGGNCKFIRLKDINFTQITDGV